MTITRCLSVALILMLGACVSRSPKDVRAPAGASVEELAAAVAKDSQASDLEHDGSVPERLAADALAQSQACIDLEPQAPACLYYRGVALGLEARAHPLRANELLKNMLESLSTAEAVDPLYDHAGPERIKALVLARAPGWPLGPGDADAAVSEARKAVALQPQHVPNQLALGEALSKSGDAAGALKAYTQAQDLARSLTASPDRDDWLAQAQRGLHP